MSDYTITMVKSPMSATERRKRIRAAYRYILALPDAKETATGDDLGGQTPIAARGDRREAGGQSQYTANLAVGQVREVRG